MFVCSTELGLIYVNIQDAKFKTLVLWMTLESLLSVY